MQNNRFLDLLKSLQILRERLPQNVDEYGQMVQENKQYPFFNENNTPLQWVGKVVEDVRKRGAYEGLQDLTNPIIMNPYVEPIAEPMVSAVRAANYEAGRPFDLINKLLGQTDKTTVPNGKEGSIQTKVLNFLNTLLNKQQTSTDPLSVIMRTGRVTPETLPAVPMAGLTVAQTNPFMATLTQNADKTKALLEDAIQKGDKSKVVKNEALLRFIEKLMNQYR